VIERKNERKKRKTERKKERKKERKTERKRKIMGDESGSDWDSISEPQLEQKIKSKTGNRFYISKYYIFECCKCANKITIQSLGMSGIYNTMNIQVPDARLPEPFDFHTK
jgi:hypothetical protein